MGKTNYKYQNLYGDPYSNFNLKLIAGIFAAIMALSLFAGLVAADDLTGDVLRARIDARVEARTAGANASGAVEVQAQSRRALDPQRAMAKYGMFRSKLAHYINKQCAEARGVDRMRCFERVLKSDLPTELREATEARETMHERRAEAFKEFAKRTEHRMAAHACFKVLSDEELLAAYAEVQEEVEPKVLAFAQGGTAVEPSHAIQVETSTGVVTVPKAFLAAHVLVASGKDSAIAQKCREAAVQAKEAAKQRFETAKQEFKDKLRELRGVARNASTEEKNTRLYAAINALVDARVKAAEKFQAHGASNASVSVFVASMEAKKTELTNSTFEQRKALLREINDEWHAFVRSTVSVVVTEKIQAHALRLKEVLAKTQGVIEQLKASGKDVTKLEALYAEADAAVTATQEQDITMREAVKRTVTARHKVTQLVKAVNAVLNNRPVPEPEATAETDAEAGGEAAPDNVEVNTEANEEAEAEA